MRDEIEFVEYVRDPQEADVHVRIVTTSTTGAGGRERAVSLVGNGRFAGIEQQLRQRRRQAIPKISNGVCSPARSPYEMQVGLTYTFGSIFNTIVNPRFGQ